MSDVIAGLAAELVAAEEPDPATVAARTLDAIGCLRIGYGLRDGAALCRFTATLAGAGDSGPRFSEGLLDDVLRDVAVTRMTELDDIHIVSCTTVGAVVVPTALVVGAGLGVSPSRYALAVANGYESMTRLGRAIAGAEVVYDGIWPSRFCTPLATAAVVATLLGLDATATAAAFRLALTMADRATGGHAPKAARWLSIGHAARAGCIAALAAARGYETELTLDRDLAVPVDEAPLAEPESSRAIERMSVKPFPSARQSVAATEAALALAGRVDPAEIRAIELSVPEPFAKMIATRSGDGRLRRLSSAPWNVALALCRPESLYDPERELEPTPELERLIELIDVRADPEMTAEYPRRWPSRVVIHDTAGAVVQASVIDCSGDAGPGQRAALERKWNRLLGAEAEPLTTACAAAVDEPGALAGLRRGLEVDRSAGGDRC